MTDEGKKGPTPHITMHKEHANCNTIYALFQNNHIAALLASSLRSSLLHLDDALEKIYMSRLHLVENISTPSLQDAFYYRAVY